jgi:hypothetical protein
MGGSGDYASVDGFHAMMALEVKLVRTEARMREAEGSAAPVRTRRRLAIAATAGIVLVLALAIGAGWFLSSYQPLSAGPGGLRPGVTGNVRNVGSFLPPSSGDSAPFVAYQAPYQDGQVIGLRFTVANGEAFPVTVEQIGFGGPSWSVLRQLSVQVGSLLNAPGPAPAHFTPFRPFAISNQAPVYIVVKLQFLGCSLHGPGETVMLSSVPVTYRSFGITHHAVLPLPYSIRVFGRGGCN